MVDVRVHLRFERDLLPGASLEERRQLYLIDKKLKTVADVVADIAREWCIDRETSVSIRGSRVRKSALSLILRNDDVLELQLQVAPVLARPASRGRAICASCGCTAPGDLSTAQWKRFCMGLPARCQGCVSTAPVQPNCQAAPTTPVEVEQVDRDVGKAPHKKKEAAVTQLEGDGKASQADGTRARRQGTATQTTQTI